MARKRKSMADSDPPPNSPPSTSLPPSSAPPSSKPKKRPKPGLEIDASQFTIVKLRSDEAKKPDPSRARPKRKDGKPDYDFDDDKDQPNRYQAPPFDGLEVGELKYRVEPPQSWLAASRYRQFTSYAAKEEAEGIDTRWIGKVLEIRAHGPTNVYVRIYWMYMPEDVEGGRKPYHANAELIASNHMEIVDAASIDGRVDVKYWNELNPDTEVLDPEDLFYRQSYDIYAARSKKLSRLPHHCIDNKECNPDDILVRCDLCDKWLHGKCIEREAVYEAYRQNNIDIPASMTSTPHKSASKRASKSNESPAFTAELSTSDDGKKLSLVLTDHQKGKKRPATTSLDIHCLVCDGKIENSGDEEATDSERIEMGGDSQTLFVPDTDKPAGGATDETAEDESNNAPEDEDEADAAYEDDDEPAAEEEPSPADEEDPAEEAEPEDNADTSTSAQSNLFEQETNDQSNTTPTPPSKSKRKPKHTPPTMTTSPSKSAQPTPQSKSKPAQSTPQSKSPSKPLPFSLQEELKSDTDEGQQDRDISAFAALNSSATSTSRFRGGGGGEVRRTQVYSNSKHKQLANRKNKLKPVTKKTGGEKGVKKAKGNRGSIYGIGGD